MEKIVIVTDHAQENEALLATLRLLFPECEVQILRTQREEVESSKGVLLQGRSQPVGTAVRLRSTALR